MSLLWWLTLDRLAAPGWVWGATGSVLLFLWVLAIVDIFIREPVRLKDIQSEISNLKSQIRK